MFASMEWVEDLLKKTIKKGLLTKTKANGVDGVLYAEDRPVMLTKPVSVYIDGTSGDDTNGDGTQAKPFRSMNGVNSRIPKNLNGYNLTLNFLGNFTSRIYIIGFHSAQTTVNFINNPNLVGLEFIDVSKCHILGGATIKFNPGTVSYMGAITILASRVIFETGTYSLTGIKSASLIDRGFYIGHGSTVTVNSWNSSKFTINNFQVCVCCQDCSRANLYNSNITYTNYVTKHEPNGGGTITST